MVVNLHTAHKKTALVAAHEVANTYMLLTIMQHTKYGLRVAHKYGSRAVHKI